MPDEQDNRAWNHFWTAKLAQMGRTKIWTYARPLRYRNQTVKLPNNQSFTFLVGQEKGIDIRIALDAVRLAHQKVYDVCLFMSQDQDLTEAVEEIRTISREQRRWIKIACAFPLSPTSRNKRGIDKTDWIRVDRATYDACLDLRNYHQQKQ